MHRGFVGSANRHMYQQHTYATPTPVGTVDTSQPGTYYRSGVDGKFRRVYGLRERDREGPSYHHVARAKMQLVLGLCWAQEGPARINFNAQFTALAVAYTVARQESVPSKRGQVRRGVPSTH